MDIAIIRSAMPDERRSYLRRAAGAAKSAAGTLGEGVSNIKEDVAEYQRKRKQVTDQQRARLERAEEEARREALKDAQREFREEYREEIKSKTMEAELEGLRQKYGMAVEEEAQQKASEREAERREAFIPGMSPPPSDGGDDDGGRGEPYVPEVLF